MPPDCCWSYTGGITCSIKVGHVTLRPTIRENGSGGCLGKGWHCLAGIMLVRHSAPCGAWIARHERESSHLLISRHSHLWHAHLLSSSWHSLCPLGVQGKFAPGSGEFDHFKSFQFELGFDRQGAEGRYDRALHFPFGQSFCQIPHSQDSRGGDLLD